MDNSTDGYLDSWNSTQTTEDWLTSNTTLSVFSTTYKAKPNLYVSQDGSIEGFIEYEVAWAIDTIYAPLCSALGIIGNTISFLVLMLSKSTTTYQYMAAISCTDTLVLILNIMFLVRKFPGHEIFVKGTCGLVFFLFYFGIHLNVVLMVTMTLERYLAIKFPMKAPGWFTVSRARILIMIEILMVFTLDVHNFFTREMVEVEGGNSSICSQVGEMNTHFLTKIWPWIDSAWYCYIPLTCLCILNILIVSNIRSAGRVQRQMTQTSRSESGNKGDNSSTKERQITVMLLLVTFCFLLLVSPMAMIIIIERYYWIQETPQERAVYFLVRTIFNNLMYTNHALNFILYFMSGKRFREQITQILCRCRKTSSMRHTSSRANLSVGSTLSVATVSSDITKGSKLSINQLD